MFLVDGNAHFNRPGPRLMEALQFLVAVLHERWELIPAGFEWELFRVLPDDKEASPDLATQKAAATTDEPAAAATASDASREAHVSPDRQVLECLADVCMHDRFCCCFDWYFGYWKELSFNPFGHVLCFQHASSHSTVV